ncbi:Deleted in malignant brain tumors 1 protein, partial [Tyto alba]
LRLSDGPHRCAGRVEVFYEGWWGTVCDDHWDLEDASVVCRQLGCGTALSAPGAGHFRAGSGPIWLDDVNCTGTEVALSYCRTKGWGKNNCHHGEDAGVVCSEWSCSNEGQGGFHGAPLVPSVDSSSHPVTTHAAPAELRLVNGPNRCSGRVEVMHDHQWGTVCDDDWSFADAAVVGRQLGCGVAGGGCGRSHFGEGSGPIWLDNVQCSGTEAALSECLARPWGVNNCHHGEDASVACTGGEVQWRLLCSGDSYRFHSCSHELGSRHMDVLPHILDSPQHLFVDVGTPCAKHSRAASGVGLTMLARRSTLGETRSDAPLVLVEAALCGRQLGCGTAVSAPGSAHFGHGSGRIWLDEVNCTGTEATLSECQARPWGSSSCDHQEDAGVVCSDMDTSGQRPLRLVNGSNSCLWRVEVFHDHKWGTVCDDTWDIHDADVVCRQLGCGTALSAPGSAHFGPGVDPIWQDGVHCLGTESALTECELSTWGEHNCGHSEDAGVVC